MNPSVFCAQVCAQLMRRLNHCYSIFLPLAFISIEGLPSLTVIYCSTERYPELNKAALHLIVGNLFYVGLLYPNPQSVNLQQKTHDGSYFVLLGLRSSSGSRYHDDRLRARLEQQPVGDCDHKSNSNSSRGLWASINLVGMVVEREFRKQ